MGAREFGGPRKSWMPAFTSSLASLQSRNLLGLGVGFSVEALGFRV